MDAPLLSIVTVCRNHRDGLARTHASLAAQRWRGFEWLVQDGGSTDGGLDLLAGLADPAPLLESGPDDGIYDAMNRGLARATGDYVLFLNAGDAIAEAGTLSRLAVALRDAPPPDLLYGDAYEKGEGGWQRKRARETKWLWYGMICHHPAILYRRAVLAGLTYDRRYRVAADYAFTLEALGRARTVRRLAVPICRVEPAGLSAREAARGRREQARIRRALLGQSWLESEAVALLQRGALGLRTGLPGLYDRLRFRR